jgi:hypothetical protein
MYSPFEDKGKIFTEVIQKKPIEVMIKITGQIVRGMIYIRPKERLKDEMDNLDLFLPVTNATVMDDTQKVLFKTHFMVIHREQVIWLMPIDEMNRLGEEGEE